jgi:hypothetical protein
MSEETRGLSFEALAKGLSSGTISRLFVLLMSSMVLALVLLWGTFSGSAPIGAQTSAQPNFVFILADDMRYDDLAYMPKTRTLLGSGGMTFSKAFVAKPLCCPSRASILTGMYVHNHKVWFNGSLGSRTA